MKRYIAMHTYTVDPPKVWKLLGDVASEMAIEMATGKLPAKCIKTWNPLPHGRADHFFCLWDAEKPEDILTSLAKFKDVLTVDTLQVDEIDWADLTKAAMAARVPA